LKNILLFISDIIRDIKYLYSKYIHILYQKDT